MATISIRSLSAPQEGDDLPPGYTVRAQQAAPDDLPAGYKVREAQRMGAAEDIARSAGSGALRGAAAVFGAPGDIADVTARGIDWITNKAGVPTQLSGSAPWLPGSQDFIDWDERETGRKLHQPQTTAGDYAQTGAEFMTALIPFVGQLSRTRHGVQAAEEITRVLTRYGLIPGAASETAGQMTEGTGLEAPARAITALVTGGGAALLDRPRSASRAISQNLPENVTPQMVDDAQRLIADAQTRGINLSWPEALSQSAGQPVLTDVMRHLEAPGPAQARMTEFFGPRPQQIESAAGPMLDQITHATPAPSTIGPAAGQAAEGFLTDVRQTINRASQPYYDAAETVRLSPQEMARVRRLPGYEEAAAAVRNDPQLARYVQGLPEDSVGFLNEVKKFLDQAAENAAGPMNAQRNQQRAAGYGMDATAVRTAAERASPDYVQALDIQRVARERFLQPLLQGPLGRIADKDITTQKAIAALFPDNPLPNSAEEIRQTVGALANRNQWAARQLVRAHIESVFNEATQALQGGANAAGGAKFAARLRGNPQQAANLEAAIRALPNGDRAWPGVNRFLQIMEATGTRQNVGSKTAYNALFLEAAGKSNLMGEATKAVTNPFARGFGFLAEKYEQWRLGRNLNELADLFTNPRHVGLFRELAEAPREGRRLAAVLARIGMTTNIAARPQTPAQVNQPR